MSISGVSVIMPIYNEVRAIEQSVASLLKQRMGDHPIEILAVDGMSTDGTTEKLAAMAAADSRIRVVQNPDRTTPYALNVGLAQAEHDFVAVLGAHTDYDPDYLATCLAVVEGDGNIAGCSGRVIALPATSSTISAVAHWVMSSRLGSSGKSFRTQQAGPADSIPYPVFRRSILRDLGGYNTRLTRNQDNDMNRRIIESGQTLYCSWATTCTYKSPSSVRALLRYAWRNGRWVAVSLRENPKAMRARHLAPALFASGTIGGVAVALVAKSLPTPLRVFLGSAPVAAHLAVGVAEVVGDIAKGGDRRIVFAPAGALGFHVAYGVGTLAGLVRPPG